MQNGRRARMTGAHAVDHECEITIEPFGHVPISPGVFPEAMHQQNHGAFALSVRDGSFMQGQRLVAGRAQRVFERRRLQAARM